MLSRIKKAYGFKTDIQLANFLGVKQNTISAWKKRNSLDLDLIIEKCQDLNLNWILTGVGPIFKKDSIPEKSYNIIINGKSHRVSSVHIIGDENVVHTNDVKDKREYDSFGITKLIESFLQLSPKNRKLIQKMILFYLNEENKND